MQKIIKNGIIKKIGLLAIAISLGISTVGCGANKDSASENSKNKIVKIGVVGSRNEVWQYVIKKLKKEGIKAELVTFSDYNQPNDALANGDIDLNSFQHRIFLENYNKEKKEDLVPIGDTVIAPLGIYSLKLKHPKDIKNGGEVVIPNDVTNQGRALKLLQTAGLIKINPKAGDFATPKDIIDNPKHIKITPVDASQTARALKDVELSVINSGMAVDAGFVPTKDAIFLEPVNDKSKPYINIIVARNKDKNNEIYKKIVKAYQTDDVKKLIKETSKGSEVPAWR